MLSRLLAATLAAALAVLPIAADARDLTPEELAGVTKAVADFDAAMRANDLGVVVKTIPPKIVSNIAAQAGMTDEALIAEMVKQMDEAMKTVEIVSFSMDVPGAEHRELADGTPYLIIPTTTTLDMGEAAGKVLARSPTLAMMQDGTWYLMRIADPQQKAMLQAAFPEFAGVDFPAGTMEPIKE